MARKSKERKVFLRAKSPPRPKGYRQMNSEWRASVKEKKEYCFLVCQLGRLGRLMGQFAMAGAPSLLALHGQQN